MKQYLYKLMGILKIGEIINRLYDPNHPVRNNVGTLDSVDEVRIIKEALK